MSSSGVRQFIMCIGSLTIQTIIGSALISQLPVKFQSSHAEIELFCRCQRHMTIWLSATLVQTASVVARYIAIS